MVDLPKYIPPAFLVVVSSPYGEAPSRTADGEPGDADMVTIQRRIAKRVNISAFRMSRIKVVL